MILLLLGIIIGLVVGVISTGVVVTAVLSRHPKSITSSVSDISKINICGCKHNKSYHEDGKGSCQARIDSWGNICNCNIFVSQYVEDPFIAAARKELGAIGD